MKAKAIILLLTLSVYFFDIVIAVNLCERLEANMSCCEETGSCEKPEAESVVTDAACPLSREEECPVSSEDDCCKYCITCPQAYVTILASSPVIPFHFTFIKKQFPVLEDARVNGFSTAIWQPPDSCLFS